MKYQYIKQASLITGAKQLGSAAMKNPVKTGLIAAGVGAGSMGLAMKHMTPEQRQKTKNITEGIAAGQMMGR